MTTAIDRGPMRHSRSSRAASGALVAVLASLFVNACSDTVTDQGRTSSLTVSSAPQHSPTRISVPTWNFTDRMPMDANLFATRLKADGACAVIGSRPPYSVVVWPRGWYGKQDASEQITIYTRTGRPFAHTGGQVGFSGGFQVPSKGSHPCLAKYPTMTMAEAWSRS